MPTYPPASLATHLMIGAGPERDARAALAANPVLRALLSPDVTNPIPMTDIDAPALKLLLGHMTQDTPCPYVCIAIADRVPEYCANIQPHDGPGHIATVTYKVQIYSVSTGYEETSDLAMLVLRTLEMKSTPTVHRWLQEQGGYEYDRYVAGGPDSTDELQHVVTITFDCLLKQE